MARTTRAVLLFGLASTMLVAGLAACGSVSSAPPDAGTEADASTAQVELSINLSGDGDGDVTSAPAGIDCGTTCSAEFDSGTTVTLTATPAAGSSFGGWSGAGCTGTGTCVVTLDAAETVTATFTASQVALTVTPAGTGGGTVTSNPAGIDCGTDCTETYDPGTVVVLTAAPDASSTFAGWSGGGCGGTDPCTVTLNAATTVTATFTTIQYTLTVTRNGNGTGTVTSSPGGIDCGGDCSEPYDSATPVTLTATPTGGHTFAGWNGGGCAGVGTCVVTMTAAASVNATFMQDVIVGNGTEFTGSSGHAPNYLLGHQIVVSNPSVLKRFGVIAQQAGANIRLALYRDVGGNPGDLVTQMPSAALIDGVTETAPTLPITLEPGPYGIMGVTSASTNIGMDASGTRTIKYISHTFGTALPATFPATHSTYTGNNFNFYLVTQPANPRGFLPEFAGASSHSPDFLLGFAVTVPTATTLQRFGLIGKTAGPNFKMALYTDSGGNPNTLVASIGATGVVDGNREVLVTSTPLAAGTYWLMANYSATASLGQDTNGTTTIKYISLPFASAPPVTFPAPSTYTGNNFNYYIVTQP